MTAFPRYEKYKDSGVEWLGEVPAHWEVVRSKRVFTQRKEPARPDDVQLSATQSYGVIPQAEYERLAGRNVVKITQHLEKRRHVEVDDFVISMRSFQGGLERAKACGCIRSSYTVLKPLLDVNPAYFSYLLKTPRYISALQITGGFIRDGQDLNYDNYCAVDLLVPPLNEQARIGKFLDQKTSEIDALIAKKQRQIELLDEQKAILINRAVTQGLNPKAPLKYSGIEWLPKIPKGWTGIKLRHLAKLIQTGPFGSQLHSAEYVENGTPVINPSHMKNGRIVPDFSCSISSAKVDELSRHKLKIGDILFARRGELGRCCLATQDEVGWICGTGSLLLRPKIDLMNPEYLVLALSDPHVGEVLTLQSVGSTMDNLNAGMISNLSVPLPPPHVQGEIITDVRNTRNIFQKLRSKTEIQIHSLQALRITRITLIAHAVTGKIQVAS